MKSVLRPTFPLPADISKPASCTACSSLRPGHPVIGASETARLARPARIATSRRLRLGHSIALSAAARLDPDRGPTPLILIVSSGDCSPSLHGASRSPMRKRSSAHRRTIIKLCCIIGAAGPCRPLPFCVGGPSRMSSVESPSACIRKSSP